MQKDNLTNKLQILSGLFLFLALVCAVATLCLWKYLPEQPFWWYGFAAGATAFFLVYVIVCAVAAAKIEQGKRLFLLAWAMVLVSVILIGLSPIAAILWVFEALEDKMRRQK